MADAEKKDIAKLSFDVQDAKKGLLDIGSLLDDLSKKSTTTFDKISKEFKSSFSSNIVDTKKINKSLNEVTQLSKSNQERLQVQATKIELRKQADLTKIAVAGEEKRKTEAYKSALKQEEYNNRVVKSAQTTYEKIATYAKTYILYQGFNELKNVALDSIEAMKQVEYRMMEISRIMEEGSIDVKKYRDELTQLAYDYARSFDDVSSITLNFARAGYDANDSLVLTEKSLLALNTAELDATQATDGLISIMAQWGMDTGTTAEKAQNLSDIIDKINKTADNFPISSEGLLEALKRTSQGFNLAGATIDETIAMIVAAERAAQRGGKVIGTAMANMAQQMRAEGKLKIADELGLDLFEDEAKTTFKSITEIFATMSEKMQQLKSEGKESSVEMQKLLELFTVFRRNIGAGLLSEMAGEDSTYAKALENSLNSVGYSAQENSKYMNTMEAATQQFNARVLELQNTLADVGGKGIFTAIVAGGADTLSILNSIIDKFGVLPVVISTATLAMSLFNKNVDKGIIGTFAEKMGELKAAFQLYNEQVKTGKETSKDLFKLLGKSATDDFKKYINGLNGADASLKGYITQTIAAKVATIGLKLTIAALEAALSFGITIAIQAIVDGITAYINAAQKAAEKTKEANDAFKQTEDDIESYRTKIINLTKEINDSNTTQEEQITKKKELMEVQKELIEKFGNEAKGIDLVTNSIDAQNESINKLLKANYKKYLQENEKEIKKLQETVTKNITKEIPVTLPNFTQKQFAEQMQNILKTDLSNTNYASLKISGNPEEVLNQYRKLYDELDAYRKENYNSLLDSEKTYLDQVIQNVSEAINKVDEKYGESINQYKTFLENRLKYDEKYSETYGKILAARAELEEAYTKGDAAGVEAAKQKLKNVYDEALEEAKNDPTHQKGMTDLIENDLEEAQKTADNYSIKLKFDADNGDLKDKVQEIITSMGDISSTDLKEMFDMEQPTEQLTKLKDLLDSNGISVEQFKDILDSLGLVFGQVSDNANKSVITLAELKQNFTDSNDALANLESGFTSVYTAMNEFNQTGMVSASTLKSLVDNDLLQYFDVVNGKLAINEAAMANAATAAKAKAIEDIQAKTAAEIAAIAFGDEAAGAEGSSTANKSMSENAKRVQTALAQLTPEILKNAAGWRELMAAMGQDTSGLTNDQIKGINNAINNMKTYITAVNNMKITAVSYNRASVQTSGSSKRSKSKTSSSKTDAKKAAEEEYKRKLSVLETYFDTIEEKENRWVKKQKELGQLSNKDFIYITQQRIKRHKQYLEQIKKATWLNAEDRAKLEKEYTEKLEDYRLEYFDYLKNILDEEIKALEDARDKEIEQLKETNSKKIELIEEEAQKRIDALKKVENENDKIRAKEEYQKKRQEHLTDISYWEQRTGREAKEALKEAKKNLKELDEEWKQQQEDWDISDQIEAIENQRDAQVKAIQDAQEAQIKAIEESTQKQIDELQRIYDARVKLFSETNQIIFEDSRIASEKLFEIYKKGFVDPLSAEFKKLEQSLKPEKKTTKKTETKKEYVTYKIKSGDTLSAIAKKYGTTVSKIMAANPSIKNRNLIYTGNKLKIPKFHNGGIVGGNQEAFALLKPNEVILKTEWAASLNRMMKYFDNLTMNNPSAVSTGPTIEVNGDLIKIEANVRNQNDINNIEKKVEKVLKDKFNIKK